MHGFCARKRPSSQLFVSPLVMIRLLGLQLECKRISSVLRSCRHAFGEPKDQRTLLYATKAVTCNDALDIMTKALRTVRWRFDQ